MDNCKRMLKPHVRTLEFIGSTGSGKTEIAAAMAEPRARRILLKGVGNANSTLTDHLMVFTTEYSDSMLVAVKYDENVFTRNQFTELISKVFAQMVQNYGRGAIILDAHKDKEDIEDILRELVVKSDDVKDVFSLLLEDQKDQFIGDVAKWYDDYEFRKYCYVIYNTVKNDLPDTEIKDNSKKFLVAIQQEVERVLDMQEAEAKSNLWKIWKELDERFKAVFFSYFNRTDISLDGYYFKELSLDNPDMDFVNAMFTTNNVQAGRRLSLEVFGEETVLYVPMNQKFADLIRGNAHLNNVFSDSYGHNVIGILDTRGLYHGDSTEKENYEYCSELLYRNNVDAIAVVSPLEGDANEKKAVKLYETKLKDFGKKIPVFVIHNKLDFFIASLKKQDFNDPLSTEILEQEELPDDLLRERIKQRVDELDSSTLHEIQGGKRPLNITALECYLKRDAGFPGNFVKEFNISCVYEAIFEAMSRSLTGKADKIEFELQENAVPAVSVDSERLVEIIYQHILNPATDKKVFTPGLLDLAQNYGKTPYSKEYMALRKRLKNGDGYTSNTDESYYYNCKSFSVNFTANLRNFLTADLKTDIVFSTVRVNGVKSSQENEELFLKLVREYMDPKMLVRYMLFENAMQSAESEAISVRGKFQGFLQKCMDFFCAPGKADAEYADAVKKIVLEAAYKALDLHVVFRAPKSKLR